MAARIDKKVVDRTMHPNRPDPIASLAAVAQAAAATPQPGASLAAIDQALAATIGHRLFTILVVNLAAGENQRVYTNQPVAYPVGGAKPIVPGSEAMRTVILGGHARFLRNAPELIAGFPDHELIRSLGCESCVNVPVRWNGTTIAMLNLLHQADWYSEADVPVLSIFAGLAVPAVLEIIKAWPTPSLGG